MRVGIISVFMDYHRKGQHNRGVLQPQIGPLIGGLLPRDIQIEVINETWEDPDWSRDYDLLFISSLHSDFDRARQLSHYWRRRGAKTVFGGTLASTYAPLCQPFFDAVAVGDAEGCVPDIYRDFCRGELKPIYISRRYEATNVPIPRFDLLADKQVLPISLEITRGCPFACEFCALTGLGTRYHVRPPELVVRDIKAAKHMLRDLVPAYRLQAAIFYDNNLGGHLPYLRRLCEALTPVGIGWGSSMTFNAVADPEVVKGLSRAGCRFLYVGLESFNPEALADMRKFQNAVDQTKRLFDQCHRHGILLVAALMLNPQVDDGRYLDMIPTHLRECGLHVPSFISFECPIPGTPHFHRLAAQEPPALLPNAYLRDFTSYTLVTRPRRESLDQFIETYKALLPTVYSWPTRLRKLAHDVPRFLSAGYLWPVLLDLVLVQGSSWQPHPDRTFVAGTDLPPPEATSVPLTDEDFASAEERRLICDPWRVTDSEGQVLPHWRVSNRVFGRQGQMLVNAARLRSSSEVEYAVVG